MTVEVHPGWYTVHYWNGSVLDNKKFDAFGDALAFDQEHNPGNCTLAKHQHGSCMVCGSSDFLLSEDIIEYTTAEWDAATQKFELGAPALERSSEPSRFYCCQCGTLHQLPEELT